eukprot:c9116_g1_i2.p1 GENE.c9116_g1_i2~~c9116_g1_i2.p1  ORF type:complete len:352 (+),score=72.19 c9116_g1_i2:917-1972(+)
MRRSKVAVSQICLWNVQKNRNSVVFLDDETGWKLLAHDVFRAPPNLSFLCAILGSGGQLCVMVFWFLLLSCAGILEPTSRGTIYVASLALYALTSVVSGYISILQYTRLGGKDWARTMAITSLVFPLPFATVACALNIVASVYGSTSKLPWTTVGILFCVWICVCFPWTVVGAILARRSSGKSKYRFPVTPNLTPRELPTNIPWFASGPFQILFAGFLPFSAVYMELFFIFRSVWAHQLYTLYPLLSLAVVLLCLVTALVTVSVMYFTLASEDYRWWWRSWACGASMGVFVCAYSVYFFCFRSAMFGLLQITFFFGYSFLLAYAMSLVLGFIGFFATFAFVRYIYSRAKLA